MRYQNKLVDIGLSDSAIKFKRSVVSAFYLHIEAFWSDEYPDVRNIFTKIPIKINTSLLIWIIINSFVRTSS